MHGLVALIDRSALFSCPGPAHSGSSLNDLAESPSVPTTSRAIQKCIKIALSHAFAQTEERARGRD